MAACTSPSSLLYSDIPPFPFGAVFQSYFTWSVVMDKTKNVEVICECSQLQGWELVSHAGCENSGRPRGGGQLKNTGDYTPLVETLGGWLTLWAETLKGWFSWEIPEALPKHWRHWWALINPLSWKTGGGAQLKNTGNHTQLVETTGDVIEILLFARLKETDWSELNV